MMNKNRNNKTSTNIGVDNHPSSDLEGVSYEIHVKGHLNNNWSDWLEGLEMKLLNNGEMILFGPIPDQAALMGVLNKLNRLNLTISSVKEMKKEK